MDRINGPQNTPWRPFSEGDPLMQASSNPRMSHPHASPMSPMSSWHAQPLPSAYFYIAHGAHGHGQYSQRVSTESAPSQPTHNRQHSALPHPDRSIRALQNPGSIIGPPAAPVYWSNSGMNTMTEESVREPRHMYSGIQGPAQQPPSAAGWELPRATSASSAPAGLSLDPFAARSRNLSDSFAASPSNTMLAYTPYPDLSQTRTQLPSPGPPRSEASARLFEYRDPRLLSLASDRRRQVFSRSRRPTNSRQSRSDLSRTEFRGVQNSLPGQSHASAPRLNSRVSLSDDLLARQMQLFRSTMSNKLVASRAVLKSLESVEVSSLAENEKTCVICYNDYGVESPEGVIEAPVRLPQCKHIFGNHCIKKWLEESNTCPYCRVKLQSEPKHLQGSARTFLNMMRVRGLPLPAGLSDEVITRLATRSLTEVEFQDLFFRAARPAERRSPPDDANSQGQRRTRQRRNSSVSEEASVADDRAAHSGSAPGAPSNQRAAPGGDIVSREGSWAAQQSVARSASPFPHQQDLQPRLVTVERTRQLNDMGAERGQATSARIATRPADALGAVVANGSTLRERGTPNPLLSRPGTASVPSISPLLAAYNDPMLSTMETPRQRPVDAERSALQPSSRIRPWY